MNNREFAETVRQYLYATGAPSSRRSAEGEAMTNESTEATHDDCILCYETGWLGGCEAFGRCPGPQTSIGSTGHVPTDRELARLTVGLDRIQRALDAMRLTVEELKQPQQGSLT